jgi:hypothetical protein
MDQTVDRDIGGVKRTTDHYRGWSGMPFILFLSDHCRNRGSASDIRELALARNVPSGYQFFDYQSMGASSLRSPDLDTGASTPQRE